MVKKYHLCLGNLEKEEEADTDEEKNDQIDLYIRWWQLNVFLPMLHFIKPPTTFPENKVSTHNLASFWLLFAGTKFDFWPFPVNFQYQDSLESLLK